MFLIYSILTLQVNLTNACPQYLCLFYKYDNPSEEDPYIHFMESKLIILILYICIIGY